MRVTSHTSRVTRHTSHVTHPSLPPLQVVLGFKSSAEAETTIAALRSLQQQHFDHLLACSQPAAAADAAPLDAPVMRRPGHSFTQNVLVSFDGGATSER